ARVLHRNTRRAPYTQFNRNDKLEAVDRPTVRITLQEPFAPFIHSLAHASAAMISPAALEKYGKEIAFNPVGTGPFVFDGWKQTDYVRGKKIDGYWKKG